MSFYFIYYIDDDLQNYLKTNKGKKFEDIEIEYSEISDSIKNYKFNNQDLININVSDDSYNLPISVKIRLNSKLLFVGTDKQSLRNKILNKIFNSFENIGEIKKYSPIPSNERELICNKTKNYEVKFIHNGKIENDEKLNQEYCQNKIPDENFRFFGANLTFNKDNKDYKMDYYRTAIKLFGNEEIIFQNFENVMA